MGDEEVTIQENNCLFNNLPDLLLPFSKFKSKSTSMIEINSKVKSQIKVKIKFHLQ